MKYTFTLIISCVLVLFINAQNLIVSSSFEQNLHPYCEGWYSACGKEITCDTFGECSTVIFEDSPGDSLVDKWSLLVWGHTWPFENYVDYYITGRTGRFIYQMKFWMNTEHFLGNGRLGLIEDGKFIGIDSVQDLSMPWTEYILQDTITTIASDTIAVRLAAGLGDFCICDVYFDQVEFNVLDSLSTHVDAVSDNGEMEVFPNPVTDEIKFFTEYESGYLITIYNLEGLVVTNQEATGAVEIDFIDPASGLYYYVIQDLKNKRVLKTGRFVKTE
jgi:hypothetical protein